MAAAAAKSLNSDDASTDQSSNEDLPDCTYYFKAVRQRQLAAKTLNSGQSSNDLPQYNYNSQAVRRLAARERRLAARKRRLARQRGLQKKQEEMKEKSGKLILTDEVYEKKEEENTWVKIECLGEERNAQLAVIRRKIALEVEMLDAYKKETTRGIREIREMFNFPLRAPSSSSSDSAE